MKAILQIGSDGQNIELMLQLERDGKARKGVFDGLSLKSLTEEFDKWSKLALNPIACRLYRAIGDGDVRAFGVPPGFDIEQAILSMVGTVRKVESPETLRIPIGLRLMLG